MPVVTIYNTSEKWYIIDDVGQFAVPLSAHNYMAMAALVMPEMVSYDSLHPIFDVWLHMSIRPNQTLKKKSVCIIQLWTTLGTFAEQIFMGLQRKHSENIGAMKSAWNVYVTLAFNVHMISSMIYI